MLCPLDSVFKWQDNLTVNNKKICRERLDDFTFPFCFFAHTNGTHIVQWCGKWNVSQNVSPDNCYYFHHGRRTRLLRILFKMAFFVALKSPSWRKATKEESEEEMILQNSFIQVASWVVFFNPSLQQGPRTNGSLTCNSGLEKSLFWERMKQKRNLLKMTSPLLITEKQL